VRKAFRIKLSSSARNRCDKAIEIYLELIFCCAPGDRGMLEYTEEYLALLREAHKRAPRATGAPTLIWHLACWHHFRTEADIELRHSELLTRVQ
jgi:hypothetical protein